MASWWLIYLYQVSLNWKCFTAIFSLKQKWPICMLHKFLNICYITYKGKSEIINQFLLVWVVEQWNKTQITISFVSLLFFFHMIKLKLIYYSFIKQVWWSCGLLKFDNSKLYFFVFCPFFGVDISKHYIQCIWLQGCFC